MLIFSPSRGPYGVMDNAIYGGSAQTENGNHSLIDALNSRADQPIARVDVLANSRAHPTSSPAPEIKTRIAERETRSGVLRRRGARLLVRIKYARRSSSSSWTRATSVACGRRRRASDELSWFKTSMKMSRGHTHTYVDCRYKITSQNVCARGRKVGASGRSWRASSIVASLPVSYLTRQV